MNKQHIFNNIFHYLGLTFGILFFIGGFIPLFSDIIGGIIVMMMGALFLPITKKTLQENYKFNLSPLKKTGIFIILLILLGIFTSGTETNINDNNINQQSTTIITPLVKETKTTLPEAEEVIEPNQEVISEEIVAYSIEEKTDYSRKVLSDKPFSQHTAKEIENAPTDRKFSYKVVLEDVETRKQIEDTANKIIRETIETDTDMDELSLNFYSEVGLISGAYDIGSATWAVNGKLGDVTPEQAKNNIRSSHKTVFQIKDNIERYLSERKISEDKFGLSKEKRQEIFRAIVAAEDRARKDAEKIYPTIDVTPEVARENIMLFAEKNSALGQQYKKEVIERYGIDEDIETKITVEGITYNWSFE